MNGIKLGLLSLIRGVIYLSTKVLSDSDIAIYPNVFIIIHTIITTSTILFFLKI